MNQDLLCPTDGVQLNETKARLVAGLVLITTIIYLLSGWLLLPLLLVIDFGLRSFNFGNGAEWAVKTFHLPYKGTDQAPRRFAAHIGLGFGLLISGLHLAGISPLIPAVVLAIFAELESLVGFCAGCHVYTFYVRLFPRAA